MTLDGIRSQSQIVAQWLGICPIGGCKLATVQCNTKFCWYSCIDNGYVHEVVSRVHVKGMMFKTIPPNKESCARMQVLRTSK